MAKWGAKNERLERQKLLGWWDRVWKTRHLLGEEHSLLSTGVRCQRPSRMVHQILGEGLKFPDVRRKGMRPRQQRLQGGGQEMGKGVGTRHAEKNATGSMGKCFSPTRSDGTIGKGWGYGGKSVKPEKTPHTSERAGPAL